MVEYSFVQDVLSSGFDHKPKKVKGNVSDQIHKTTIHFEYKIFHHLERCDLCSLYESFIRIHVRASCACLLPDRGQKMALDPRKLKLQ